MSFIDLLYSVICLPKSINFIFIIFIFDKVFSFECISINHIYGWEKLFQIHKIDLQKVNKNPNAKIKIFKKVYRC